MLRFGEVVSGAKLVRFVSQSKSGFGTKPANGRLSVSIFEQFNNESRGERPNRCGQNRPFLRLSYERTQFVFEPMMRHSWPALNCKHNAEFLTVAGPIIVPLRVIQPF